MAYDEAKMSAMRGDSEPDPKDPAEESEGETEEAGPSEPRIMAARRFCAAVESKNYRAMLAAFDDMDEDEPSEEE